MHQLAAGLCASEERRQGADESCMRPIIPCLAQEFTHGAARFGPVFIFLFHFLFVHCFQRCLAQWKIPAGTMTPLQYHCFQRFIHRPSDTVGNSELTSHSCCPSLLGPGIHAWSTGAARFGLLFIFFFIFFFGSSVVFFA